MILKAKDNFFMVGEPEKQFATKDKEYFVTHYTERRVYIVDDLGQEHQFTRNTDDHGRGVSYYFDEVKVARETTFYLYAWFGSYLINGDDESDLSEVDQDELQTIRLKLNREMGCEWRCISMQDECIGVPELGGLPGQIAEFTFQYQ